MLNIPNVLIYGGYIPISVVLLSMLSSFHPLPTIPRSQPTQPIGVKKVKKAQGRGVVEFRSKADQKKIRQPEATGRQRFDSPVKLT